MTTDKTSVEEAEIVEVQTSALSGPQAVMLTPSQLKKQMERDREIRKVVTDYIATEMVEGKDYGVVQGKTKSGTEFTGKPSLLKPGGEKFCGLFKVRPTFRKDTETVEMLGTTPGIVAYVCELVNTRGEVVGEGRGVYKVNVTNDSDFDINKAVKIAEKRAQIDAVLRTGGLSDFFTQDTEDMPADSTQKSFAKTTGVPAASDKQIKLIDDLQKDRFYNDEEFGTFAVEATGVASGWNLKQASELIALLFKQPKLERDQ